MAWIGVDLDGTLAEYHGWVSEEHIGEPIAAMVDRVKKWLKDGKDVRIFTARVDGGDAALAEGNLNGEKFKDIERIKSFIYAWCEKHIGRALPITNRKDYSMIELWDDRAVQVVPNTGQTTNEHAYRKGWCDAARECVIALNKAQGGPEIEWNPSGK